MFDVRETDIQLLGPTRIQYTKALFYEHEPSSAPYTMCTRDKERDGRKVISYFIITVALVLKTLHPMSLGYRTARLQAGTQGCAATRWVSV